MVERESNADEGPKLREEANYQDFYPTLKKDDDIPLLIHDNNVNVDDIYINQDIQNLQFNQGTPLKQLISNGRITVEPIIVDSEGSDCHYCNISIMDLDGDDGNNDSSNISNSSFSKHSSKNNENRINPFQGTAYVTKFDKESYLYDQENLLADNSEVNIHFNKMKKQLYKIIPNLQYVNTYYDMDEQDELFLRYLKKKYLQSNFQMDNLQFELFFTILELEYALLQSHIIRPPPPPPLIDQVCSICNGIETTNNTIVFCDSCNIAVHQDCYGIIFIPPGPWLCRVCLQNNMRSQRPRCIVCPGIEGPMKQTTSGNWIHVICAVWINELNFGNWHYLEPIEGVERIPNLRWKLNCFICKQKMGACIQCSTKNCFTAYHVSCAKRLGLFMTPLKTGSLAEMALGNDNQLISFCDKHSSTSGQINQENFTESGICKIREQILEDMKECRARYQDEIIIPPHIFADYIYQSIISLKILQEENKAHELSFIICKYWSLKREFNKGAPLIQINDNIIQYSYNLLSEDEINDKISFIDVILKDLNKIEKLAKLVDKRNEKEIELFKSRQRVQMLIENTNLLIIKEIFFKKFVESDPFKVVSRYLKENKLDEVFIDKCKKFQFTTTFEFEDGMMTFFQYLKKLNVVSRIISSSIDKMEANYYEIMSNVRDADIHGLLTQDFIISDDIYKSTVERPWNGKLLMKQEELSDIEDLKDTELEKVDSLCFDGLLLLSSLDTNRSKNMIQSFRKKVRGRPGRKPGRKPKLKPGPKPKGKIDIKQINGYSRSQQENRLRHEIGSSKRLLPASTKGIRKKPGRKPKKLSILPNAANIRRKKPGPKPKSRRLEQHNLM